MKKTIILLTFFLLASQLPAQDTLSLDQCRNLALKHNKEMAAAIQQSAYAKYMQKSYLGNFFPDFAAGGTGLYSTGDGDLSVPGGNLPVLAPDSKGQLKPNGSFTYFPGLSLHYEMGTMYQGGISVKQPIFMGGKIWAAYRIATLGKEMAQYNEQLTASEVIVKTEEAYVLVVKANEMKKVADTYHELLVELLKNVESAYKHGIKSRNDLLKVKVRLNESQLKCTQARNAQRLATMNLCHYIGKPLMSHICVSNYFPNEFQSPELQHTDITSRPEYSILNKQVAIAKEQVKLNRSELLPKIGIQGSYNYMHGLDINKEPFFDQANFSVLLNVSIPLFHFGERSNKVRAAKAQLRQKKLEQANLNEQMLLELTQAVNNVTEAQLEKNLSQRTLEQADESRRVSLRQYQEGLESLSNHLESQALWQKAYESWVESRFNLYLSYLKYKKANGSL